MIARNKPLLAEWPRRDGHAPIFPPATSPRQSPYVLLILLAGLLIVAGTTTGSALQSVHKINNNIRNHNPSETTDFDRWMMRIPLYLERHAEVVDEKSFNTPLDMLILSPLTHVSRAAASVIWMACKPLMVAGIVLFLGLMVRNAGVAIRPVPLVLALAAWMWPVLGDIGEGQTNLLMLLPLVAGLWAAQHEESRKMVWLGGLLIALAAAIKVTPLAILAYALWRGRWRLAVAIGVGLVVWTIIVPGAAFGWEQNLIWQFQWSLVMLVPYARGHVHVIMGESVPSFLTRLLRHVPAFTSGKSGHSVDHYMNVLNLSVEAVGWIIRLTILGLGAAGAWWTRRRLESFRSQQFIFEIGVVGALMLWVSQWTLVAHYVTLALPLCAVAMIASAPANSRAVRPGALGSLCGAAVLMYLTSDISKLLAGRDGREYMLMVNVCLGASALLVGAIVAARHAAHVGQGFAVSPGLPLEPVLPAPLPAA